MLNSNDHYGYLKFWEESDGKIHTYRKGNYCLTTTDIVYETIYQNKEIESPILPIITNLNKNKSIVDLTTEERKILTNYIVLQILRTPKVMNSSKDITNKEFSILINEFKDVFECYNNQVKLKELDEIYSKYKDNPNLLIKDLVNNSLRSTLLNLLIFDMSWRVVISDGPSYFITSDNPVSFFESYEFGRLKSEFAFPLSPQKAIIGNWKLEKEESIFQSQFFVRAINKRTASFSDKFLFYNKEEQWIKDYSKNKPKQEEINRIIFKMNK